MQPLETSESKMRLKAKYRERASGNLFNGHRPATIDEACDKTGAKAVVDINDSNV